MGAPVTLNLKYTNPQDGDPAAGTTEITLCPSAVDTDTAAILPAVHALLTWDSQGEASATFPANDDPDLGIANTYYHFIERPIDGLTEEYDAQLLGVGTTQNLSDVKLAQMDTPDDPDVLYTPLATYNSHASSTIVGGAHGGPAGLSDDTPADAEVFTWNTATNKPIWAPQTGGGTSLSSSTPLADTTGAGVVGTENAASHGDHQHPLSGAYVPAPASPQAEDVLVYRGGVWARLAQGAVGRFLGTPVAGGVLAYLRDDNLSVVDPTTGSNSNLRAAGVNIWNGVLARLIAASNLSDLTNVGTARSNLALAFYDIGGGCTGKPAASLLLVHYKASRAMTLAANFGGSKGNAVTTVTATAAATVKKNGSTVGTITWGVGNPAPTFATTSGATVSLAADDILTVVAPSSQDATLADLTLTLVAVY